MKFEENYIPRMMNIYIYNLLVNSLLVNLFLNELEPTCLRIVQ